MIPLCGDGGGGCIDQSDLGLFPPPVSESPDPWGQGLDGGGSGTGTLRGATPLSAAGSAGAAQTNGGAGAPMLRRNQYWVSDR